MPAGLRPGLCPLWWCEECEASAFPTLLDSDYEDDPLEPNGDDEPDDDCA